jgi:Xaa-Pro aminopeptidase
MQGDDLPPVADEITIQLRKPIKFVDQEYAELNLREPSAIELAKAMKEPTEIEMMIALIQLTSGVPRRAVEQISQRDLGACADFFAQFSKAPPLDESART